MNTDVAIGNSAGGCLVHEFAVHVSFYSVTGTDNFTRVPFADRLLCRRRVFGQWRIGVQTAMFFGFGTGHEKQIALMLVFALDLNTFRPNFVGRLNVHQYTGIVRLGGNSHKPPFHRERVITVRLRCAEIAARYADATYDSVGNAPGVRRIGVVPHTKRPAGEILAVEQLDLICRKDNFVRVADLNKEKRKQK